MSLTTDVPAKSKAPPSDVSFTLNGKSVNVTPDERSLLLDCSLALVR